MAYLKLLGGAILEGEAGVDTGPATHRHSLAILALLACAPSVSLSRGKLVGHLWPDVPEKTARNRLNTCVHRLRGALGPDAVVTAGGGLRLNLELVGSDVLRFRKALEAGEPERAVSLYEGPFLDGFWLRGSPAFEQWADLERDRLRRAYLGALEQLAADADEAGDLVTAARWWNRRAREDPYDTRVAMRRMKSLAAAGSRAEALEAARIHTEALRTEYGAEPSAKFRALAREIGEASDPESDPPPDAGSRTGLDPCSLAVLPFENVGRGEVAEAFSDGLQHDLLTRLSGVGSLTVISRTSVLGFRNVTTPLPEIARSLSVGTIVEGSVQHAPGRVRLNVQLIDARSDTHLWAETFDRELNTENIFEIQSELAARITGSLQARLTPREEVRVVEWTPTRNLEAFRRHTEGRVRLDERTEDGMRKAVGLFRRAIAEDPEYAPAYVGLADALTLLAEYGYEEREAVLPEAEEAVDRALSIDPALAGAYATRGMIHEARQQGPAAIRELERAVELQPSYADAHNWLSWTNQLLGRAEDALASARRAVELNPLSPEAVSNYSISLLSTGRSDDALVEAQRGRELQTTWNTCAFYEALALFDLERHAEAAELLHELPVPWAGSGPRSTLAVIHADSGETEKAHQMLAAFEKEDDRFAQGVVHAALGSCERALDLFDTVERWEYWPALALHHHFRRVLRPLREHARFSAILGELNRAWGLNPDGSLPPETMSVDGPA